MSAFRRFTSNLAKAFPTKATSDRFLPYATLTLAALGAGVALFQYANGLAISRVTATMELHKQYLSETFRTSVNEFRSFNERVNAAALEARCDYIKAGATRGSLTLPQGVSLDCKSIDNSTRTVLDAFNFEGEQRIQLREQALAAVRRLSSSSDTLAQLDLFYRSIIICVKKSNCSGDTAVALFAREMVAFVNATCAFDNAPKSAVTTNDEIAKFLVEWNVHKNIYWNRDQGREKLFACPRQREFEN
jgi:hypothetical protein